MFNRIETKAPDVEEAVGEVIKSLDDAIAKLKKETFTSPADVIKLMNMLVGFSSPGIFGKLDSAYKVVAQTPNYADDRRVVDLQRDLENVVVKHVRGCVGATPIAQDVLAIVAARMRIAKAISSFAFSEVERDAIVQAREVIDAALVKVKSDAALVASNPDLSTRLNTLQDSTERKITQSGVPDTTITPPNPFEPLFNNLSDNLDPTINTINSNELKTSSPSFQPDKKKVDEDVKAIDNIKRQLAGMATTLYEDKTRLDTTQVSRIVGNFIPKVNELITRYSASKPALRELEKLSQLMYEVLHEHRVVVLDGSSDPRTKEFLRPSRTENIPTKLDASGNKIPLMPGLTEVMLGTFKVKIDRAEEIGRRIALLNPADRAAAISQDEQDFLVKFGEEFAEEVKRQSMNIAQSLDVGRNPATATATAAERKANQDFKAEFEKYMKAYLDWLDNLQKPFIATRTAKAAVTALAPPPSGLVEHSIDYVVKSDVSDETKFPTKQLILDIRLLWTPMFARLELPTDQSKAIYNNKYDNILNELRKRRDKLPDSKEKDELDNEITYLVNRREFGQACIIGTTSGATVDYDALYKGSGGWHGVETPVQFNEGHIVPLFYSPELTANPAEITDPKERQRVEDLDDLLTIRFTMLLDKRKDKGFGASRNFTEVFQGAFEKEVEVRWKRDFLHDTSTPLTPAQKEVLKFSAQAMAFLDFRQFVDQSRYIAGGSPPSGDDLGKTNGKTTELTTGLKDLYVTIGKARKGFVVAELLIRRLPDEVEVALESDQKKQNNFDLALYATELYDNFYSLSLDEGVADKRAWFKYESETRRNPVQLNCEALWPPKTYEVDHIDGKPKKIDPKTGKPEKRYYADNTDPTLPSDLTLTRDAILKAAGSKHVPAKTSEMPFKGFMDGGIASHKFTDACQKGFEISGDMEKDVEGIKNAISEMAEIISPTKSNPTLHNRRLANYLYEYCRLSLQAFREKYSKHEGRWLAYTKFLRNMRSTIQSVSTAEIGISPKQITDEFRARYGFGKTEKITIARFVLRLLPDVTKEYTDSAGNPTADLVVPDSDYPGAPKIAPDVKERIKKSAQIDPIMLLNDEEEMKELRGEKESLRTRINLGVSRTFRAGPGLRGAMSPLLQEHRIFYPRRPVAGDRDDRMVTGDREATISKYYSVIVLPPLTKDKKIVDPDDKNGHK